MALIISHATRRYGSVQFGAVVVELIVNAEVIVRNDIFPDALP